MSPPISAFFERHEWSYEELDAEIWRTTFSSEEDEDFDLYVALSDDWMHFAVSPVTPLPQRDCQASLHAALLRLNQQITLARFAVDEDGDVNLLIDLPLEGLDYAQFAVAFDTLVDYTRRLGQELARVATRPGYQSPLF